MKKKNISYGWIISIVILIILFIPIISDFIKSQKIDIITVDDIAIKVKAGESFLVYSGELDKKTRKELRKMRDKTRNEVSYDYGVYNILDEKELNEYYGEDTKIALVIEGDIQKTYSKYDKSILEKDVLVYLVNDINDSNRSYKVFDNFNAYKKQIKKDEVTMIVYGYDGCGYCNRFQPVYNAVANKYNLDIYYFNSNKYDSKEYEKVINYDLTIPGKCGKGEDFKLSDGFGTPLTIFTKKGKVVDCIGGYVDRAALIEKLKEVKMISE